jgi:hypothetical protein
MTDANEEKIAFRGILICTACEILAMLVFIAINL